MFEKNFKKLAGHKNKAILLFILLVFANLFVFWRVLAVNDVRNASIYFLNVGQGDSEFITLPGGVEILIDGGPANGRVLDELSKILPATDRYIDLVIFSHPQLDHFGGLIRVLERYNVGAVISNGIEGTAPEFASLEKTITDKGLNEIAFKAGDNIKYENYELKVISPTEEILKAKDINKSSLVLEFSGDKANALFAGDIDSALEAKLASIVSTADILKVSHHGSKFSSSPEFLKAIKPRAAVIEVGKNSYGHPTPQVLEALAAVGSKIYRTDLDGTLKFELSGKGIRIFRENKVE